MKLHEILFMADLLSSNSSKKPSMAKRLSVVSEESRRTREKEIRKYFNTLESKKKQKLKNPALYATLWMKEGWDAAWIQICEAAEKGESSCIVQDFSFRKDWFSVENDPIHKAIVSSVQKRISGVLIYPQVKRQCFNNGDVYYQINLLFKWG